MDMQISKKLNSLQGLLREGVLAPTGWLEAQGYSRALLSGYIKNGWLVSPARGVYRRPGPPLKWQHAVASLQFLRGNLLHVGGRTALAHRGFGHYVQMSGAESIHLYWTDALPAWLNRLGLSERFVVHSDALFGGLRMRRNEAGELIDDQGKLLDADRLADSGLQPMTWGAWDWQLWYSSDERAIFEVLQDVPTKESVYEADVLMQGLGNLRPARVTAMLRACTRISVKRLFLALAERHRHAWLKHVELDGVNLGKGKRMLVRGGKLHPKYLITLPRDLDDYAR